MLVMKGVGRVHLEAAAIWDVGWYVLLIISLSILTVYYERILQESWLRNRQDKNSLWTWIFQLVVMLHLKAKVSIEFEIVVNS